MQAIFEGDRHVVGCCHLSGLWCSGEAAGPVWEFADRRPNHKCVL